MHIGQHKILSCGEWVHFFDDILVSEKNKNTTIYV